jgi:hypothetical protein
VHTAELERCRGHGKVRERLSKWIPSSYDDSNPYTPIVFELLKRIYYLGIYTR